MSVCVRICLFMGQEQWLTPVIMATWEAEIRRITVPGQFKQNCTRPYLNQWLGAVTMCLSSRYAGKHRKENRGSRPEHKAKCGSSGRTPA
jgi:hypothetical protein